MANRDELYIALRNADAAGDTAAAQRLAQYIQQMQAVGVEPTAAPEVIKQPEGGVLTGIVEPIASLATSIGAAPIAGIAGIGASIFGGHNAGGNTVEKVQNALTYQPRTKTGQEVLGIASYPFEKLAEGADYVGGKTTEITGSPAIGAAVNTTLQAAPAAILKIRGMRGVAPALTPVEEAAAASVRAQNYVASRTGLDWNSLSGAVKQRLTDIAKDATALDKLNPESVAREARLKELNLPSTRGQVDRNIAQLTREENITKTDAGAPIRDILAQQDEILHGHLDTLRAGTGAKATTRQGLGTAVQNAERAKLDYLKSEKTKAYNDAREQGALAEPADISPLQDWLKNPTNARNAGYLKQAIDDYIPKDLNGEPIKGGERRISINDLEEIRKEASANRKKPGPEAHFAGEAIKVIDDILDDAGGDLYKVARAKNRALNNEFDRQGRVAKLVDEKGYTTDRAVALEDTLDHVIKSSAEEIGTIRKSLTEGGNAQTQLNGAKAWQEIQAGVLDHLKEKAAGKRAIVGEKGQLEFNSSFREAFKELDADGKIDIIFSPTQAMKLRQIYDAVGDVRTKPSGRIAGSDTTSRILSMLEGLKGKISSVGGKVPLVGDVAAGLINKGVSAGLEQATARHATRTPLSERTAAASENAINRRKSANTLKEWRSATLPTQGQAPQ